MVVDIGAPREARDEEGEKGERLQQKVDADKTVCVGITSMVLT
jgi:hypothetical protein